MVDIVILNPPNPPAAVSNKDTMGGFGQLYEGNSKVKIPPIDIPYLGAVFKKKFNYKIIESLGSDLNISQVISAIKEANPAFIFIRTSTSTFFWDLKVAKEIKKIARSKVVLFGPHCSIFPDKCIEPEQIDFVILSEPETVAIDIVNNNLKNLKGVYYKKNGAIIKNKEIQFVDNLDSLLFPTWEDMPYKKYNVGALLPNEGPFVTILTSRGCPFSCYYCPYSVGQGARWRYRSAVNVVDEMDYLEKKIGIKALLFRDAVFTFDQKRTRDICDQIIKRNINIKWRCETRVNCLGEELVNSMAKAGCIGINLGIESASDKVLENIGRGALDREELLKIIRVCKQNNIDIFSFFIIGLPGETKESILEIIDLAYSLNSRFCQFTLATPYLGTKLRQWAIEKEYIINESWDAVTGYTATMRNENLSLKQLENLRNYANLKMASREWRMKERILNEGLNGYIKNIAIRLLYFYYILKIKLR